MDPIVDKGNGNSTSLEEQEPEDKTSLFHLHEWEEPKSQYKSSCQSYKSIAIRNEITTQIPGYSMVFHV